MTEHAARQIVLAKFPNAKMVYNRHFSPCIGIGITTILGKGRNFRAAWADAAKRIQPKA